MLWYSWVFNSGFLRTLTGTALPFKASRDPLTRHDGEPPGVASEPASHPADGTAVSGTAAAQEMGVDLELYRSAVVQFAGPGERGDAP